MDFFELLKQGKYHIEDSDISLWSCWDDSRVIYLKPDDKHSIWVTYNTETLLIYTVLMIIGKNSDKIENAVSYRWMNPKTWESFKNDKHWIPSYHNNEIMIEDENDMDFITLKLKYT